MRLRGIREDEIRNKKNEVTVQHFFRSKDDCNRSKDVTARIHNACCNDFWWFLIFKYRSPFRVHHRYFAICKVQERWYLLASLWRSSRENLNRLANSRRRCEPRSWAHDLQLLSILYFFRKMTSLCFALLNRSNIMRNSSRDLLLLMILDIAFLNVGMRPAFRSMR